MEQRGDFFDGTSSARHPVTVRLTPETIVIRGPGIEREYPVCDVRVDPRLGGLPRTLRLPGGGRCEIEYGPLAARFEKRNDGFFTAVHRWEMSLKRALTALAVTAALIWGFLHFGIPILARPIAHAVPPAAEARMGEEGLRLLDRTLFAPSALPVQRCDELEALFADVTAVVGAGREFRLELRASPRIGANAFALPGGIVILTDELVALAVDDGEIAAVLAHEVAHIRHRHAIRHIVQNSAAGLIVAFLVGDVASITSLAAALPTLLIDSKYSRDMELEADALARDYLDLRGLPRSRFSDILLRMESSRGGEDATAVTIPEYLSTHPETRKRVENFR